MQRTARRSGLRRLLVGSLAVLAAAALTACGEAQPGVAASIGGDTISVLEVQKRTVEFYESYPEAKGQALPELVESFTVENFLRGQVVEDIAAEYDLEPTQGDLDDIVERDFESLENYTRAVANEAIPASRPDLVMAQLRSYWIQNALRDLQREELGAGEDMAEAVDIATREIILEFSRKADVSVNPRFGTWNGSIVTPSTEAGSGSISIVPGAPAGDSPVSPG